MNLGRLPPVHRQHDEAQETEKAPLFEAEEPAQPRLDEGRVHHEAVEEQHSQAVQARNQVHRCFVGQLFLG